MEKILLIFWCRFALWVARPISVLRPMFLLLVYVWLSLSRRLKTTTNNSLLDRLKKYELELSWIDWSSGRLIIRWNEEFWEDKQQLVKAQRFNKTKIYCALLQRLLRVRHQSTMPLPFGASAGLFCLANSWSKWTTTAPCAAPCRWSRRGSPATKARSCCWMSCGLVAIGGCTSRWRRHRRSPLSLECDAEHWPC